MSRLLVGPRFSLCTLMDVCVVLCLDLIVGFVVLLILFGVLNC